MKTLLYFLGSLPLAIALIGTTALFVVVGTIIESITESHIRASYFTYGNPAFLALLVLFFVNILASSLKRWPFKPSHIPFLTTHLGLLMILAGVMIKTLFGIQGHMVIWEGSGSHELFINEESLRVEDKQGNVSYVEIKKASSSPPFSHLVAYAPHSRERRETWIKGKHAIISGLPPITVHTWREELPLPSTVKAKFLPDPHSPWEIIALRTENIVRAAEILYKNHLQVLPGHKLPSISLSLDFSPLSGCQNPSLCLNGMEIPLNGPKSLLSVSKNSPIFGPVVSYDLTRPPLLAFIQDLEGDTAIFYFDPYGRIYSKLYRMEHLETLVVYDEGFGGYAANVSFRLEVGDRKTKEHVLLKVIQDDLKEANSSNFSPPLVLLNNACEKNLINFAECLTEYLFAWNQAGGWLYDTEEASLPTSFQKVASDFEWNLLPKDELKALYWICRFFSQIDPRLKEGKEIHLLLHQMGWPIPLGELSEHEILTEVTRQLYSLGSNLPDFEKDGENPALLFSAYLRVYGIHLKAIEALPTHSEQEISLESPITLAHLPLPSLPKVEDNVPVATFAFYDKEKEETRTLSYDRQGNGLCWPIFNGSYLVRFQPKAIPIPYHLHLKEAKQTLYPDSHQPFRYECALSIHPFGSHENKEEIFLSMNQVHETWNGYRFYLAGISPADPGVVKRVQLIVNYDPAKYYLTYPGGLLVALGIFLLFWFSSPALTNKHRNRT